MILIRHNTMQLVAACVLLPLHVPKRVCLYVLMAFVRIAGLSPSELAYVGLFWGLSGGGWAFPDCLAVLNFEVICPWTVMLMVSSGMQ